MIVQGYTEAPVWEKVVKPIKGSPFDTYPLIQPGQQNLVVNGAECGRYIKHHKPITEVRISAK